MSARSRYGAGRPSRRFFLAAAAVLGGASGIVGTLGAGSAAAQPASPTLQYSCSFPVIGDEPITATISMDVPPSLAVGASSPPFAITATAAVNGTFAFGLRYILGVRTIEGSLDAETSVNAPQGETGVPVHLTITPTGIPASGSFAIPATGTAPTLTFSEPGSADVTAGDFTLHLVPLDANGNITNPGRINVPCTLNSGQDNVVTSFDITGTRTTTGPAAPGRPGTPGTPGSPGSPGSGKRTDPATAEPTTHSTTGSPTPDGSGSATAGPATAVPAGAVAPDPTGSPTRAAATAKTAGGLGTVGLILLAVGILVVAAAVLRFAPRLNRRRRPDL